MNTDLFGNPIKVIPRQDVKQRREHLTFRGNIQNGRHGWLRLTPAYSLYVVKEILADRLPNELVLDPFSGTGTTPLASAELGIPAHSVDINPFLVWLGNIKLATYSLTTVDAFRTAGSRYSYELHRQKLLASSWIPNLHQIEKWWDSSVLNALACLFARIKTDHEKSDPLTSDLLKIAFCRTMIETANVSFAHQSMSFKKRPLLQQESLLASLKTSNASQDVAARFLVAVEQLAESLANNQPLSEARVYWGDSRYLNEVLPSKQYTKVVTSPPYPNRMSYIRELRPYMYWLGFLTNGREAGELDWQAIGGTWGCATSNLSSWKPIYDDIVPFPKFGLIISSISKDHILLGRYVHKYFQDIKIHLQSLKKVMAPGGRCYYIVGNSKFYGTLLPVEEIYAALFEDLGFVNSRIETLRKRSSKKELYEYIVYAEAPRC